MKKLKVGIIGLGVGEQHIAGYHSHPACQVVALCDFSDDKLAQASEKYPDLKLMGEADELLEDPDIDIVSIASYDNHHYEQIVKGINHHKHLFVEKPLCLYEHEAEHIRGMLNDNPQLKLSSNLILRMSPRFRLLKKMIEEEVFGELFYVEGDYNYGRLHKITDGWRGKIDFYSVVYGGAVHLVDLLLWLTGDRIVEVVAFGNNIASRGSNFRYNDLVVSLLKFQSGMLGKVTGNLGCIFPHFHALSVYGTGATFVNGLEHATLFTPNTPPNPDESESKSLNCNRKFLPKKQEVHGLGPNTTPNAQMITADYPGVHKGDLIYSFIEAILNDSPAMVTVEDVFETMSVCFAIEKAVHQSASVTVKYI